MMDTNFYLLTAGFACAVLGAIAGRDGAAWLGLGIASSTGLLMLMT